MKWRLRAGAVAAYPSLCISMQSRHLDNYLRTHRLRAGLSQDEFAELLGTKTGTRVSRYERGTRVPGLDTALACEAAFGIAVRLLFRGRYERIETAVNRRRARQARRHAKSR